MNRLDWIDWLVIGFYVVGFIAMWAPIFGTSMWERNHHDDG